MVLCVLVTCCQAGQCMAVSCRVRRPLAVTVRYTAVAERDCLVTARYVADRYCVCHCQVLYLWLPGTVTVTFNYCICHCQVLYLCHCQVLYLSLSGTVSVTVRYCVCHCRVSGTVFVTVRYCICHFQVLYLSLPGIVSVTVGIAAVGDCGPDCQTRECVLTQLVQLARLFLVISVTLSRLRMYVT